MPSKRPPLKSAFDIPATEHPVLVQKNHARKKPARSSDAFANLIATHQPDLDSPFTIPAHHRLLRRRLDQKVLQVLIGPEISAIGRVPGRRKTNMEKRSLSGPATGP